jgi:type IV pilus assembly protein PilV
LVEILIAVLIAGIGGLGVASMQLAGMKYSAGAKTRTQASLLATDMLDRIRANRRIAIDKTLYNTEGFESGTGAAPSTNCYTTSCDPEELAEFDKVGWLNQVSTLLPQGQARVAEIDLDAEQRIYQISLRWRNVSNRQGDIDDADEMQEFTFRGAL